MLKYSEVNRTNLKQEEEHFFKQLQNLSPTLNSERRFILRVMEEGKKGGRRMKVILPNG